MTIGEIKNQPEIDEPTINLTNEICRGLVQIGVGATDPSNTPERYHDDLDGQSPQGQYNSRIRCSAGNDNCNARQNNQCNRNPPQQNRRRANNGRQPNWGDRDDARLPPLRLAFRDSNLAQPAQQARPSRIPVPCPCQPEQPRRQDRPVDLYTGSRLPVPYRAGQTQRRIPRRNACDAPPARPCAPACEPADRRGTYDVQPPPCGDQNSRRGTFTVQPVRRDTYDVQQPCAAQQPCAVQQPCATQQPCAALHSTQRSSCNVQAAPNCGGNMSGSFAITGTIQLDGFPGLSPVRPPPAPRNRSLSCGRLNNNNDDSAINAFLDNQLNCDMVAPRSMAVPGQPYVRIDETTDNATPERWRRMMDNRSSIGSQPMGILSPAYDEYRGSRDTSADSSRLSRWSSSDRHSRPFGLNDSFNFNSNSSSTPCDRPSRARSAAPDCGQSVRPNRCRRDTFDRNTR